jgi:Lrp/AsnC family transcriptional regulator, leucine-responsive regulatory protein
MPIVNIDKKNKKIIDLLTRNSRISLKELSQSILSSKQATSQRIKRLEKSGIKGYKMIVDNFKLGFENLYIYLKISGLDESKFSKKIIRIKKYANVGWIARLFGDFDLAISLRYKNKYDLSKFIGILYKEFNKNIKKTELFFSKEFIIPSITFNENKNRNLFTIGDIDREYSLLPIQEKIIKELEDNAKMSYSQIAEKTKISPKTIKRQLKIMEREKVILGYTIILDYNALNLLWNSCILHINPGSDISPIIEYLTADSRVSWIAISIENRIMFDFLSEDFYTLRNFVNTMKIKYNDEILDYKTMNISSIIKEK